MVPADSDRISPVPPYSGYHYADKSISLTGLSPPAVHLSRCVLLSIYRPLSWSYYPTRSVNLMVWAPPRSLATTYGITIVFFSSGYLDVSVHRVRLRQLADDTASRYRVAPFGNLRIKGYLHLPEAYRSLSRPSSPLRA